VKSVEFSIGNIISSRLLAGWTGPTLLLIFVLASSPAHAYFALNASCPEEVEVATVPSIDVELQSQTGVPIEVHLSAGYLAEGDSTLFGKTLIGPETASPRQFLSAFETRVLSLATPPTLPATPGDGVVEFFVMARAEAVGGESSVKTDACMITLPEPALSSGLALGVLGLGFARPARRLGE